MDIFPSSEVFPTFNKYDGNFSNVSASADIVGRCGKGSRVTYFPLLVLPLATVTGFFMASRLVA